MTGDDVDIAIRRAMGGDHDAIDWIVGQADTSDTVVVVVMAALLQQDAGLLMRAGQAAGTSRDRQVIVIARAHLDREAELVDALARDHLVDYPDSLIVSWIASCSTQPYPRSVNDT